jgi:hypothetical protein
MALTSRYAVPAIYAWREFTTAGGLISYRASVTAAYRLAGTYARKDPQRRQTGGSSGHQERLPPPRLSDRYRFG